MLTAKQSKAILKARGIGTLLGKGSTNAKTAKSDKASSEFVTSIMYLTPHSEFGSLCPFASAGCSAACLYTAGRGGMNSVHSARLAKTRFFMTERAIFIEVLVSEISRARDSAYRQGKRLALRLNGTSDIVWEKLAPLMFTLFPDVQFYDYTKIARRFDSSWELPANYHLTFSRSESNSAACYEVLAAGGNVAVVFDEVPVEVHSADTTDLRFLDPSASIDGQGVVVGVSAKGAAKADSSGFVVRLDES